MTFQPRMTSIRDGISVLGDLKWRAWNGVVADVWNARCSDGARGEYVAPHPRLFIILDKEGGEFDARLSPNGEKFVSCQGPASFIPAEIPVWTRCEEIDRLRHLDVHFDPAALSERLLEDVDLDCLATPRLAVSDERILGLARLIAAECESPDARHDLYGDSLTVALLIDVLQLGRRKERKRTPLTSWQLRRVTDFIEDNCTRSIRLQELAELVALSQTYFSHAFKASTGVPPHQWQMSARIRRVQELLLSGDTPLTEVAAETGFSDQAHFTRTFRRIVGETPAAWQRARRA
jgi:AraC-like DNA-binding protein